MFLKPIADDTSLIISHHNKEALESNKRLKNSAVWFGSYIHDGGRVEGKYVLPICKTSFSINRVL